jgi:hypothetical protein|tara:strand:- start:62 stop:823 length:762 start_codon:yes stop_codon:yes gene_type:complete
MEKIENLKVYWWGKTDHPTYKGPRNNFGDIITPFIFSHYKIKFQEAESLESANCISTGSVARFAKENDLVLGSGIIFMNDNLHPKAIWKFVRGPFSRLRVLASGGKCPNLFGDPALLLPNLYKESKKEFEIGLVPHYFDKDKFKNQSPSKIKIIDIVNSNPLEVVKDITSCKKIISTSLHGIICAHAYGIPAAWLKVSNLFGDDIKFYDYYASVNMVPIISKINDTKYQLPKSLNTQNLIEVFEEIANNNTVK